jgi:hypothetical protein
MAMTLILAIADPSEHAIGYQIFFGRVAMIVVLGMVLSAGWRVPSGRGA